MAKNVVALYDYKELLKNRYGYDEEFAQTLSLMAENLVDYLGTEYESVVYDAIANCKYEVAKLKKNSKVYESTLDVLKREKLIDGINADLENSTNIKIQGISIGTPNITYEDGTFEINGVKRVIALPHHFNPESISSMSTLFRSTLSMIESYLGTYEIEGDILTVKKGLATDTYKMDFQDGKIKTIKESSLGKGIEEGTNSYDELCFMREYYDEKYEPTGFSSPRIIAGYMYDNLNLRGMIREAQITKDYNALREVISSNTEIGYDEFLRELDRLSEMEKEVITNSLDQDKLSISQTKRDNYFETVVAPNIQTIGNCLKREEVMNNGYSKS